MAFQFRRDGKLLKNVRRLAARQIAHAASQLAENPDRAAAVHEARKSLKRLRALLRLVRPALRTSDYKRENARFRDIARMLSASRDRKVMLDTLASLAPHASAGGAEALSSLDRLLRGDKRATAHDAPAGEPVTDEGAIAAATEALEAARQEFAALDMKRESFAVASEGLEQSYRRARQAFAQARETPGDEELHEWRKGVQTHWRHMSLLSAAWPAFFRARIAAAKELSELLGADHDLAVLSAFADGAGLPGEHRTAFVELATRRQKDLRERSFALGALLFADDPKALAAQVDGYWQASIAHRDAPDASPAAAASPEATTEPAAPQPKRPVRKASRRRSAAEPLPAEAASGTQASAASRPPRPKRRRPATR